MNLSRGTQRSARGVSRLSASLALCLMALIGNQTSALAVYSHTINGIKHGTTGVNTDGDVWAYMRVLAGDPLKQALISVVRASGQHVATKTCYSGCSRIDVHHHPVANECVFQIYAKELTRVDGHFMGAC
jgi:hypothetical protein